MNFRFLVCTVPYIYIYNTAFYGSSIGPLVNLAQYCPLWLAAALQHLRLAQHPRFFRWICQGLNQRPTPCQADAQLLNMALPWTCFEVVYPNLSLSHQGKREPTSLYKREERKGKGKTTTTCPYFLTFPFQTAGGDKEQNRSMVWAQLQFPFRCAVKEAHREWFYKQDFGPG